MRRLFINFLVKIYIQVKRRHQELIYENFKKLHDIHPSFRFNGDAIHIYGKGKLKIGANSYIGSYSSIQLNAHTCVSIGDNCMISHNVRMYTSTAIADQNFNHTGQKKTRAGNIEIGNGVWIGVNVYINPGVKIGDNSVIGANSVVLKDVAANAIVGGIPARLVRYKTQ